ncbi:MAG: hypothetical protein WCR67_05425 [Bacilli bacterium]
MKSFLTKTLLVLAPLCAFSLASCGGTSTSTPTSDDTVDFVAVTSTSWDAEVTVGQHIYTMGMALNKDNTTKFTAVCVGEAQQSDGPGGPGGFGGFGANDEVVGDTTSTSVSVDYTSFDFSTTGTWSLEAGYGYIINLVNPSVTIHTDYDTIQGRHQFYYQVTTSEGSATTLFQTKDSAFRKTLASDYQTWDVRDSTYIFTGETTGNNSSVALAYLYAHKDGSLVYNTASGSSRAVTLGLTWALKDNAFTMTASGVTYTSDVSINTEHPGFRLVYSSNVLFCSTKASVTYDQMTNSDFDGITGYQFTGSNDTSKFEMNLIENSTKLYLYQNSSLLKKGTYAFANEKFTFTFEGEDPVEVTLVDGVYTYSFEIVKDAGMPWESRTTAVLTYTPAGE